MTQTEEVDIKRASMKERLFDAAETGSIRKIVPIRMRSRKLPRKIRAGLLKEETFSPLFIATRGKGVVVEVSLDLLCRGLFERFALVVELSDGRGGGKVPVHLVTDLLKKGFNSFCPSFSVQLARRLSLFSASR